MPSRPTVAKWVVEDTEGFSGQYARAREMGLEELADEALEIAEDGTNDWVERQRRDGSIETVIDREHVDRSRLRVDARKWLLSKRLPKVYGDKQQHEVEVREAGTISAEPLTEDEWVKQYGGVAPSGGAAKGTH